jgi:GNAT superfamily N-acetyltransferase
MIDTGHIRRAMPRERGELRRLQALSLRELGRGHYTERQIESFIAHIGTMDDFLLHEGTYYVVQIGDGIAACGGWSRRIPNYANFTADHGQPISAVPKIRSVYVHPAHARRGQGRRLVEHAEAEAVDLGYTEMELTATLPGVPLYRALGYEGTTTFPVELPDGQWFAAMAMRKALPARIAGRRKQLNQTGG